MSSAMGSRAVSGERGEQGDERYEITRSRWWFCNKTSRWCYVTLDVSNDTWLETWRPIGPKKSLNKPAAHEIVKAPIGPKKSLKKPAAVKAMKAKKAT